MWVYNTLMVLCEKCIVFFASSYMRSIVFPALSTFPEKLIGCIVFGSASITCCWNHLIIFLNKGNQVSKQSVV